MSVMTRWTQPLPVSGSLQRFRIFLSPFLATCSMVTTIRFAAANTKQVGWFKQTIYFAGAFLALWILVSLVASRDHRGQQPANA